LGGWVFDFFLELGVASGVAGAFMEAVEEAAAANMVKVVVKEPKHISTRLARMSAMLAGKTTPDRATMLHNEFPFSPTWRANCLGVRHGQICKGATQAVVG
jgi:hypothetical protein